MTEAFAIPPDVELVLASNSRGRRELMERAGYPFRVQASDIPEPTEATDGNIRHYVADLAWQKAEAVATRLPPLTTARRIVIAADTVGWHKGAVVGKPDDEAHARRIIEGLAGTTHELWSGVCLWHQPGDWQICWQEVSHVQMLALSSDEIEQYLATRQWVGCSGAYAIQMPRDPYLKVVDGSSSNVIGLPMESLGVALRTILTSYLSLNRADGDTASMDTI